MYLTVAAIAGLCGITLGVRFKVLSVLPASVLIAIGAAVLDFKAGASGWNACLQAVLAVIALQFGYVIGAMLARRWHIFSAP